MDKVRVAVIGVGHLGQHHARNYAELRGAELVAVVDSDRRQAVRVAAACNCEALFDHRSLIGRVDAVSIVVPTIYHYEVARDFLANGVHTLVEKPITSTVEQARELIDLAEAKKLTLQVGHIERFNSAVQKLREYLSRPAFIECHRMGPYTPRVKDVGVVLDLMIHDIDIILQIVDSPLVSIDATGAPILSEREDIANARFTFANGCRANLTVSRVSPNRMRKIRIFQENAYISIDYQKQGFELYTRETIPNAAPNEPPAQIVRKRVRLRREEPLAAELAHFVECVRSGKPPQVTGEHGHDALRIAVEVTEQIHRNFKMFMGHGSERLNGQTPPPKPAPAKSAKLENV